MKFVLIPFETLEMITAVSSGGGSDLAWRCCYCSHLADSTGVICHATWCTIAKAFECLTEVEWEAWFMEQKLEGSK